MKLSYALAVLCIASCSLFTLAAPAPGTPYRTHFKEKVPLRQNLERVAVQLPGGTVDGALRNGFPALQIAATQLERHAVKDWVLVSVPLQTEQGMFDLVKNLTQLPEVDFASPVFVDDLGGPMFVTPYVLAAFESGVSAADKAALLKAQNMEKNEEYGALGIVRLHVSSTDGYAVLDAANAMAQRTSLLFAEPDMCLTSKSDLIPNDPQFGDCWGLLNTGQSGGTAGVDMKASQAWDITTGSASIITVIFDNGGQQNHPDLNQVPGNDFTDDAASTGNGGPVNDFDNHGTAVAGCVSATINNGLGTVGVAPGTKTAAARFVIMISPNGGTLSYSWLVDGLNWASTIGARVTNNSNTLGGTSAAIDLAYSTTRDNGMVHFASAGNDASNALGYPSSLPSVNAVSAVHRSGALASFSNYNAALAFSAPGQDISTTDRTGADGYDATDYVVISGTSFASPYAAGVAALLLSHEPWLNAFQVEATLKATATDLGAPGFDIQYGYGMVNAYAALTQVVPPNDQVCDALPMVVGSAACGNPTAATTVGATDSGVLHSCANYQGADVWFSLTVPASGNVVIETSQTGIITNTGMQAYSGGCGSLVSIACDDASGPGAMSRLELGGRTPGETIHVAVWDYLNLNFGTFGICAWEPPPVNDLCGSVTAAPLAVGNSLSFTGYTSGATDTGDFVPGSILGGGNPVVWHAFTTVECADITVSYCNTAPEFLNVYIVLATSCPADDALIIADSYNYADCGDGNVTQQYFNVPAGTYYLPVLYDAINANGPYEVQVIAAACTPPPTNDDICDAIPLTVGTNGPFSNVNMTVQVGEPQPPVIGQCTDQLSWCDVPSHSVWFSFVAPPSGRVSLNFGTTATWDSELAVWSALDCADLLSGGGILVAANDDISGLPPYEAVITPVCVVPGETYYVQVDGYGSTVQFGFDLVLVEEPGIGAACDDGDPGTTNDQVGTNCICAGTPFSSELNLKVFLQGPYDSGTGLMHDDLRANGLVPLTEPYTALGYVHVGGGGESTTAPVLATTGNDAIVDWVLVELRDATDPTIILGSQSALLQRDGDIVDVDGTSSVQFDLPPDDYHVALLHRNHLAVLSLSPVALSSTAAVVDFVNGSTVSYGTDGLVNMNGARALWAGDVTFSGNIQYTGAGNDRDPILQAIGGSVATNTVTGYLSSDVNMDGTAKYTGAGNDRDVILVNIGGTVATNVRAEQLP